MDDNRLYIENVASLINALEDVEQYAEDARDLGLTRLAARFDRVDAALRSLVDDIRRDSDGDYIEEA